MSTVETIEHESPWPPAVPVPVCDLLLARLHRELAPDQLGQVLPEGSAVATAPHWQRALHAPLADFLGRPSKLFRASICEWAWYAAGGTGEPPVELLLAVEALHAGSLIVDDIEDEALERRNDVALHLRYGIPCALNAGNWLYFWPARLIADVGLSPERELAAYTKLTETQHRSHLGQGLDVSVKVQDIRQVDMAQVAAAKSMLKTGALLGLSSYLGALAAGAGLDDCGTFARFGDQIGDVLQTLDDVGPIAGDGRSEKVREDLVNGAPTWVWAAAAERLDADRYDELVALAVGVQDGDIDHELLHGALRQLVPADFDEMIGRDLDHAVDTVRPVVRRTACLDALQDLFRRLRASYG